MVDRGGVGWEVVKGGEALHIVSLYIYKKRLVTYEVKILAVGYDLEHASVVRKSMCLD